MGHYWIGKLMEAIFGGSEEFPSIIIFLHDPKSSTPITAVNLYIPKSPIIHYGI